MTDPVELIGLIYDAAVSAELWPELLGRLATTFRCSFADVFARTETWSQYKGVAVGMDDTEYQQEFLGVWTKRNIWAARHPVRVAGEIITTSEMVPRAELERSEMFSAFLGPRDLHEGLRLSTWSGEGWVNDISLLRSWSVGAFTHKELELAAMLLPHLQRAVAISRSVQPGPKGVKTGLELLAQLMQPALLVDGDGRLLRGNPAADALALRQEGIRIVAGQVQAASRHLTAELHAAIAAATLPIQPHATAVSLEVAGGRPMSVLVMPVSGRRTWPIPDGGAVLLLITQPVAPRAPDLAELRDRFRLTAAETALAAQIAAGGSVASMAASTGRSVHTIRTHLARLMQKTHTSRQSELVRCLLGHPESPSRIAALEHAMVHQGLTGTNTAKR
jgi:DNA-binding CsgD family transcriptional regulator